MTVNNRLPKSNSQAAKLPSYRHANLGPEQEVTRVGRICAFILTVPLSFICPLYHYLFLPFLLPCSLGEREGEHGEKENHQRKGSRDSLVICAAYHGILSGAAGFGTGKGEKLSNSQAAHLAGVAWVLLSFSPFPVSNPAAPPCATLPVPDRDAD